MVLKDFIEKFICRNSLIRLWYPDNGGHIMLVKHDKDVCMEHEILNDKVWQSDYKDYKVIGVTDILVADSFYKEAINIVLEKKNEEE